MWTLIPGLISRPLKNARGQSLVQVMVSVGVMSVLLMAFTAMTENQSKENQALSQKLAASDLQKALVAAFADGSVCKYITSHPSVLTFDSTQVSTSSPQTITPSPQIVYASISPSQVPGAIIAQAGKMASPYAPALLVQKIELKVTGAPSAPSSGPGQTYSGAWVATLDPSTLVRQIANPSVSVLLTVDTTTPTAAKITACQSGGNSCWIESPLGLYEDPGCGNVGIGTSAPQFTLDVKSPTGSQSAVLLTSDNPSTGGNGFTASMFSDTLWSSFSVTRARNIAASPQPLQANDSILAINAFGYTGAGYAGTGSVSAPASIGMGAAGPYSPASTPTYITFATTPSGAVNGMERMRIDSDGRVGIGTTSPVGSLQVSTNWGTAITSYSSSNTPGWGGGFIAVRTRGSLAAQTYSLSGDRIGQFDVTDQDWNLIPPLAGMELYATEDHSAIAKGANIQFSTVPNGTLGAVKRMTIGHDGNIGIGTTAPTNPLDIQTQSGKPSVVLLTADNPPANNGVIGVTVYSASPTTSGFAMAKARGTKASPSPLLGNDNIGYVGGFGYGNTSFIPPGQTIGPIAIGFFADGPFSDASMPTFMQFITAPVGGNNGVERMRITSAGNVGIGTTAPSNTLDVHGGVSIHPTPVAGSQANHFRLFDDLGQERVTVNSERNSASSEAVVFRDGLNVGVDQWFEAFYSAGKGIASGPGQVVSFFGGTQPTGNERVWINSGTFWVDGACVAGIACTSDMRLKDHVRPFKPGLDALLEINPVYYRYNGLGGEPKSKRDLIGVLAQDVEKGAPELVTSSPQKLHPDDDFLTDIKHIDYQTLKFVLINAVKELYEKWLGDHEEIQRLKAENEALKAWACAKDPAAPFCP